MKVGTSLIIIAVLSVAAVVEASPVTIWPDHDGGTPIPGLPGYRGYTVFLRSSDPDYPAAAWDGSFDGPMNQLLLFDVLPTTTMTLAALLGADVDKDSHFLLGSGDLLIVEAPTESDDHLDGVFGIRADAHQQDLPFAYLVIADGDEVVMRGGTTDAAGTGRFSTDLIISSTPMLGDANYDGEVNVQDLSILATNWMKDPATWCDGNFNDDTVVDAKDLAILATYWGAGENRPEVPEPAVLSLLGLGGCLSLLRWTRLAPSRRRK